MLRWWGKRPIRQADTGKWRPTAGSSPSAPRSMDRSGGGRYRPRLSAWLLPRTAADTGRSTAWATSPTSATLATTDPWEAAHSMPPLSVLLALRTDTDTGKWRLTAASSHSATPASTGQWGASHSTPPLSALGFHRADGHGEAPSRVRFLAPVAPCRPLQPAGR